jgi:hypothetical protein
LIKAALLRIPGVTRLNTHFGWFQPPKKHLDYVRLYDDTAPSDERPPDRAT